MKKRVLLMCFDAKNNNTVMHTYKFIIVKTQFTATTPTLTNAEWIANEFSEIQLCMQMYVNLKTDLNNK